MIKFKIDEEHEFILDEIDVSNYLKITLRTLRKRLNGTFNADIKNKEYIAIVSNNKIIKNRELYEIKSESIKLVIDRCYKDLTKQKEHAELYEELSQISGLYSYVKDKVNIKRY